MIPPESPTGRNADLPVHLHSLYTEAQAIAGPSPRSAAVLLWLLTEQLAVHVGYSAGTLNARIRAMAKDGLLVRIWVEAIDTIEDISQATHQRTAPRHTATDEAIVSLLFDLIGDIVTAAVTRPRQIAELQAPRPKG